MGRPDYIFGQFQEIARCRDTQHGGGVCCALASQLVFGLNQLCVGNVQVKIRSYVYRYLSIFPF